MLISLVIGFYYAVSHLCLRRFPPLRFSFVFAALSFHISGSRLCWRRFLSIFPGLVCVGGAFFSYLHGEFCRFARCLKAYLDEHADRDWGDFDVADSHLMTYIYDRASVLTSHIIAARTRLKTALNTSSVDISGPPTISFTAWSAGCPLDGRADRTTLTVKLDYHLSNHLFLTLEFKAKVQTNAKQEKILTLTPVAIPFDVTSVANKLILGKMQKSDQFYESGWDYLEKNSFPAY